MSHRPANPEVDIALATAGNRVLHQFAKNAAVGASEQVLWENGLGTYAAYTGHLVTTAAPVRVVAGGSGVDAAAGVGAQQVTVYGVDSLWRLISETLTTAGAAASAFTSKSFLRVYLTRVTRTGTYHGVNAGNIRIGTLAGVIMSAISTGVGTSQVAYLPVPAGYSGVLANVYTQGLASTTYRTYIATGADDVLTPFSGSTYVVSTLVGFTGLRDRDFQPGIAIPEKSDLWITTQKTGGGTTSCEVGLRLLLSPN